jgi:hypothetical protein
MTVAEEAAAPEPTSTPEPVAATAPEAAAVAAATTAATAAATAATTAATAATAAVGRPGSDFLLKDIERANTYRLELVKLMLAMATGLLAFTVSFRPSIAGPEHSYLMWGGWLLLALSIVGGVLTMRCWELFYISYRDFDNKGERDAGKSHRKTVTLYRRIVQTAQYVGLLIAVVAIGIFAAVNIDKPPRAPATAAVPK